MYRGAYRICETASFSILRNDPRHTAMARQRLTGQALEGRIFAAPANETGIIEQLSIPFD
jgi:hypothetical protein